MNADEQFELTAAKAEQEYSDGRVQELHDQLVDTIPLMSNVALDSMIALMEVELRERDLAELDQLPF